MERALKAARKQVKMITYKGEGHGYWPEEDEIQSAREIIAFLEPHLSQNAADAR